MHLVTICFLLALASATAVAASKPHLIAFGKWTTIKLLSGATQQPSVDLKIRPLYVDGILKAYTFGIPHDITDRTFAVQRVIRVNDLLPSDKVTTPEWVWLRSGWLVIDRVNGHIAAVSLPDFDPDYSPSNWYRDYIAYCGLSQDGRKLYAVVVQFGRRKPILRKLVADIGSGDPAECAEPSWQRQPPRVTFLCKPDQKVTYSVRGAAIELSDDDEEEKE
jgi:hypothetical protein